jgi:cyclohexadienyl dehydratase
LFRIASSAARAPWVGLIAAFALTASIACAGEPAPRFEELAVANRQVASLLRDRLAQMPAVAAVKWMAHAPVSDPVRERQVLESVVARAAQSGLDVPATRQLFELQIRLARELQERQHREWTRSGRCAPCESKAGLAGLRERIDAINEELLAALYVAASVRPREQDAAALEADAVAAETVLAEFVPNAADRRALFDAAQAVHLSKPANWERIKASGILRIGTTGDYAPFSAESGGGALRGADISLALDLARALDLRPVFIRIGWPTLTEDLRDGRFDVALSGISYTPERASLGLFSVPYHHGGKTLLARCAQRDRFDTLEEVDRSGVRVIVNPGGTNERYVRSTLHHATIVTHTDNPTTFAELVAGTADVMITDDVEAELQSRRHPELCRTYRGTLTRGDKHVLAVRDERLLSAVNSWLSAAIEAGLPQRLLRQAMADESAHDTPR